MNNPDDALARIRRLVAKLYVSPENATVARLLAFEVHALDGELSLGGVLPTDWARAKVDA
jgi:hypothetical protein